VIFKYIIQLADESSLNPTHPYAYLMGASLEGRIHNAHEDLLTNLDFVEILKGSIVSVEISVMLGLQEKESLVNEQKELLIRFSDGTPKYQCELSIGKLTEEVRRTIVRYMTSNSISIDATAHSIGSLLRCLKTNIMVRKELREDSCELKLIECGRKQ
jgi:hypothetical protein